jgi:hypothetical protein
LVKNREELEIRESTRSQFNSELEIVEAVLAEEGGQRDEEEETSDDGGDQRKWADTRSDGGSWKRL